MTINQPKDLYKHEAEQVVQIPELRLLGAPQETISLDIEIDAIDLFEKV